MPAYIGFVERISSGAVEGWAIDRNDLARHLRVKAIAAGRVLGSAICDLYREHLYKFGAGDGRYGFRIPFEIKAPFDDIAVVVDDHLGTYRLPFVPPASTGLDRLEPPSSDNNTPAIEHETKPTVAPSEEAMAALETRVQMLQGRLEKWTGTKIEGWAWDPQAPNKRIRLEMVEGDNRLSSVVANMYRSDLVRLGCGDGRHGFCIELKEGLLSEGSHVLDLRCADTGATMPGSPILVECRMAVATGYPTTLLTAVAKAGHGKLDVGVRPRHAISRSDYVRYRRMEHFATRGITASVLSIADSIRETGTLPSRFLTDSMISAWLLRKDLQQRFQQLDEETCQYALLAWFLCVRPIEEGLALSCEPTGPILTAMSRELVAEETGLGAGCTALMLAAYCYVASYPGSGLPAPRQCREKDIVVWFFCEGAYHLRVSHAIPQNVRAGLAAPRSNGVSSIVEWVAHSVPAFDLANLAKERGSQEILAWLDAHDHGPAATYWRDLLRESLIVEDQVRFDDPPDPVLPPVCKRLRDAVPDMSELLLIDGQPEYLCADGNGKRLLLKGEWYPPEAAFVWSHAPISTVLFCIAGGSVEWVRIGLIFHQSPLPERVVKVMLNYNTLWSGTIGEASSGELILACTGQCLAHDAPNLLQIEVGTAFVPAEQSQSSDHRRLGIPLKRIWIQRAKGLSE